MQPGLVFLLRSQENLVSLVFLVSLMVCLKRDFSISVKMSRGFSIQAFFLTNKMEMGP